MRPQRGVAWTGAEYTGVSLVRAWESAKHPRIAHGKHGGQFARVPGGPAESGRPSAAKSGISVLLHSEVDRRGMGDPLWLPLEHAAKALDNGDVDSAIAGLTATADEAYKAGLTDDAETLRAWADRISGVAAPAGKTRSADELYQALKAAADKLATANFGGMGARRLRAAQRAMERGDRAGFTLAAQYIGQAVASDDVNLGWQKKLRELQHEVLNVPEPALRPAGPARTVQAYTSKGAKIVPGLLGGGRESWNGQVRTSGTLGNPNAIADMEWDGSIGYLSNVAAGLNTDLSMTGEPIRGTDNLAVPLHELIHGVIGGQEAGWLRDREAAKLSENDDNVLRTFAGTDEDIHPYTLDQIASAVPWYREVGGKRPSPAEVQAVIGSLEKRGLLVKDDLSAAQVKRIGHRWRLTPKGDGVRRARNPETFGANQHAYQKPEVQAIEEGFTELGTIQHAPQFFDQMGVGGRKTMILASARGWDESSPPGPETQRQVAREIKDLLDQSGDGHVAKALALWDEGKWNAAVGALDTARNRSLDPQYAWLVDGIMEHVPSARAAIANPEYDKVAGQLRAHLFAEQMRIATRLTDLKTGLAKPEPGRVSDETVLAQLDRALARAANDISKPGAVPDIMGALEEIARLRHSGDPVFAKDADRLQAEVDKLQNTPVARIATLSEYARRLQDRDRILNGDAWGHYPQQTAWALQWAEAVARAEMPTAPGRGAKFRARVVELSDEVNREGAANKLDVMAGQAIRAAGPKATRDRRKVVDKIRSSWLPLGSGTGVFTAALDAAKGK